MAEEKNVNGTRDNTNDIDFDDIDYGEMGVDEPDIDDIDVNNMDADDASIDDVDAVDTGDVDTKDDISDNVDSVDTTEVFDESSKKHQERINNYIADSEAQRKAHNDALVSIDNSKVEYGVTSDMIAGNASRNGLELNSLPEPGCLKFTYFDGYSPFSGVPSGFPAGNGVSFYDGKTSALSFTDFNKNVDVGIYPYMSNTYDGEPLPGSVKVEGIYNNHPFHMILDFDPNHPTRSYLYGFLEDLQNACDKGLGKEFLRNPSLNFGFYDNASVDDVDPKGLLKFVALSAKLSVIENRVEFWLNNKGKIISEHGKANWEGLLECIKTARKDLSASQEPADIFSQPGLSNTAIDYGDGQVDLLELAAKAEFANKLATDKQMDFIKNNFNKLSPAYKKYFLSLTDEQKNNVNFNVASDAIRGMVAREKLKNYLPKLDKRWKTMDTREAEELAMAYRGEPTLQQQRFLARYLPEAYLQKLDYAKAKAAMGTAKATDKLLAMAGQFADIKDKASLTCSQALGIVKAGIDRLKNSASVVAPAFIARHVAKFKAGVKEQISSYTMAQWQKDCLTVPPFESQVAFVKWHRLDDAIQDRSKSFVEKFPNNSCALYSKRIRDFLRYRDELASSPPSQNQRAYLKSKGIVLDNDMSYRRAQSIVISTLYEEGILNKKIASYLISNPELGSEKFLSAVTNGKTFTIDERKELNNDIADVCSKFEKFKRTYEIHESLNRPAYSLLDVARQVAAQHYETTKSFEGADKEIAKVLVCTNFDDVDKSRHIEQYASNIAKRLDKSAGSISKAEIIADTIARVLPQNLKYKESMEKYMQFVNNAQKGLEVQQRKAEIKQEVNSNKNENFKDKSNHL